MVACRDLITCNFTSDENQQRKRKKRPQERRRQGAAANWLLWIAIIGAIPLLMFFKTKTETVQTTVSRHELIQLMD